MDARVVCPGCALELPRGEDTHYSGYYTTSPECWSVYTEVLEREYSNTVLFGRVHQLTVDAYAVQHAGGIHKPKSVCVHLLGLCLALEKDVRVSAVVPFLRWFVANAPEFPVLPPPRDHFEHTMLEVALADDPIEHEAAVRALAHEAWIAWKPQHDLVLGFAERVLEAVDTGPNVFRG